MKLSPSVWAIALPIILAIPAFPKCANEIYTIWGTIQECCSKNAVKNAKVFVFVNDEAAQMLPWPGLELPNPQFPETTPDGLFFASYLFSTFKSYSFLFGHNCSKRPKTVELFIIADGYPPTRRLHKNFTITDEKGIKVIHLADTCMTDRVACSGNSSSTR